LAFHLPDNLCHPRWEGFYPKIVGVYFDMHSIHPMTPIIDSTRAQEATQILYFRKAPIGNQCSTAQPNPDRCLTEFQDLCVDHFFLFFVLFQKSYSLLTVDKPSSYSKLHESARNHPNTGYYGIVFVEPTQNSIANISAMEMQNAGIHDNLRWQLKFDSRPWTSCMGNILQEFCIWQIWICF
jgi:hypothetical protein